MTTSTPQLSRSQAEALAANLYTINGKAKEFASERDQNFQIQTSRGLDYLLKISNSGEDADVINLQTCAMEHIAKVDPAFPAPRVIRSNAGLSQQFIGVPIDQNCIVRMLTFLPGAPYHEAPHSSAQRRNLGRCLATLDRNLEGFSHPASRHDLLWDISKCHKLKHLAQYLPAEGRDLVERFMDSFERYAEPRLPALRAQVIHNDLNPYNILVDPTDPDLISGIIDYGDIIHAPLVGEVAVAAAYQLFNGSNPLASAADLISAYQDVIPLHDAECEVLPDLVAARLVITVLITEWRAPRYPHNRAYIMRNNPPAWAGLQELSGYSRDEIRDRLLGG